MPFLFLTFGILFIVAGARNTQTQLLTLLKGDFLGKPNFLFWFASILIIGALGYVQSLRPVSRAFLALVIIVLLIENNNKTGRPGVFAQALQALQTTEKAQSTPTQSPSSSSTPSIPVSNSQSLNLDSLSTLETI